MRTLIARRLGALLLALIASACGSGPLEATNEHGWLTELEVGERFTDGFEVLQFDTTDPVSILDVKSIFSEGRLEPLGASIAGPGRAHTVQSFDAYPPDDPWLGPLVEVPTDPLAAEEAGLELLIGYEVSEPGRAVRSHVEVTYEVEGRRYRDRIPAELVVCTPEYEPECDFD
jgi:hypothetical protein